MAETEHHEPAGQPAEENPEESGQPEAGAAEQEEPAASTPATAGEPSTGQPEQAGAAAFPQVESLGHDAVERAAQLLDRFSQAINQRIEGLGQDASKPARRADVVLHDAGDRVTGGAADVGYRALQLLARAREEAEDIWAEAQHIRHRSER